MCIFYAIQLHSEQMKQTVCCFHVFHHPVLRFIQNILEKDHGAFACTHPINSTELHVYSFHQPAVSCDTSCDFCEVVPTGISSTKRGCFNRVTRSKLNLHLLFRDVQLFQNFLKLQKVIVLAVLNLPNTGFELSFLRC